jgi:hypothetical protein
LNGTKNCAVDGCETGGYLSRGWCNMHYARWKRHGEPGTAAKQHAVSWSGAQCKEDECTSSVMSIGYCTAHYKRFRRYGDASIKRPTKPAEERFWAKVDKRGPDECWPWTAGTTKQGYGGFHPAKTDMVLAHRYAYEAEFGPIEDGDVLDHMCHNGQGCPPGPCKHRLCCNPAHLDPTTRPENVNRSHNSNIQKTRCPQGHSYSPENTRYQKKFRTIGRSCLTCSRARDSIRRSKARANRVNPITKAA